MVAPVSFGHAPASGAVRGRGRVIVPADRVRATLIHSIVVPGQDREAVSPAVPGGKTMGKGDNRKPNKEAKKPKKEKLAAQAAKTVNIGSKKPA